MKPIPVTIETPYRGDVEANLKYAWQCLANSLERGEAPFMGHLLYTQVLDDKDPNSRKLGLSCDRTWLSLSKKCIVYTDRGISHGMQQAIEYAVKHNIKIEYRQLCPSLPTTLTSPTSDVGNA